MCEIAKFKSKTKQLLSLPVFLNFEFLLLID
jgi:hypothetical protein